MNQSPQSSAIDRRKKLWIQILAFLAIVAIILLKPRIEEWVDAQNHQTDASVPGNTAEKPKTPEDTDWVSPFSPPAEKDGAEVSSASKSAEVNQRTRGSSEPSKSAGTKSAGTKSAGTKSADSTKSSVVRMDRPSATALNPSAGPERSSAPKKREATAGSAELGKLKEIRNNVFQSSAGLVYRSGSEDGHRLKHVMQHAKDNPQKKIHGVFDGGGDRNIVLAVIDEAYLKASKGGSEVRSQRQNDRQVYTVNLRRRIGQVGGEEGERKGHPECRYVRIVLENDNEVITAYPTSSF